SVLLFTEELWMTWRCAGCLIERFTGGHCRNISAPIMIRCIGFINGEPICAFSEVREIKTVPYVPLSHPFVERLIGTVRRECLDQTLFWTATDLEQKLRLFQDFLNHVS